MIRNKVIAGLITLFVLCGCKTIEDRPATANLVVQYAALKYIEKAGDASAQAVRAARVKAVAEDVRKVATGAAVTIAALEAVALAQLPADLSPADKLLATGLVQIVVQELQARVGGGLLDPEQLVTVQFVLDAVISATAYAG